MEKSPGGLSFLPFLLTAVGEHHTIRPILRNNLSGRRLEGIGFRRIYVALFSVALLVLPVKAGSVATAKPEEVGLSTERLKRIHETVQRHIDARDVSGAITVVSRRGRIAYFETQGMMDLDSGKPMSRDAIFRLASMSKPVTAAAVLMLLEQGKLRLSDPVSQFIPEFKTLKVAVANPGTPTQPAGETAFDLVLAKRGITIRDLLTHTSGFMSGGPGSRQAATLVPRAPTEKLSEYIPRLAAVPLDFQPGTEWRYSATGGFDVLGRIVEIASGQPYDQFLKQHVFDPLDMKDTGFVQTQSRASRLVTIYRKTGTRLERIENQNRFTGNGYVSGSAGLMSTTEDYLQFAQMLVNGGQLNGKRLFSPKTIELMASDHVGDLFPGFAALPGRGIGFGLGVAVIEDAVTAGLRVSNGSFGWMGAYGTLVWINPKEKLVALIMIQTNNAQVQRDFENAVMQAIVE